MPIFFRWLAELLLLPYSSAVSSAFGEPNRTTDAVANGGPSARPLGSSYASPLAEAHRYTFACALAAPFCLSSSQPLAGAIRGALAFPFFSAYYDANGIAI